MLLNVLLDKIQSYFGFMSFRRERFCVLYWCMSLVFYNEYKFLDFHWGLKNRVDKSCMDDVS